MRSKAVWSILVKRVNFEHNDLLSSLSGKTSRKDGKVRVDRRLFVMETAFLDLPDMATYGGTYVSYSWKTTIATKDHLAPIHRHPTQVSVDGVNRTNSVSKFL
jgi:hypothetical protein